MRKKKRVSKRIRWAILMIILILPLFYFTRRVYILIQSIHEEQSLKKQMLILRAESEVLRNRISEYKRGTVLEAKARDDLGMIKKNEKVYIVPKQ